MGCNMTIQIGTLQEKLNLAKTTSSNEILNELKSSLDMNIRRAVARNINSSPSILEKLAMDPVENVSYMAVQNPNCPITREFYNTDNPCITCEEDERTMNCVNCNKLCSFYNK